MGWGGVLEKLIGVWTGRVQVLGLRVLTMHSLLHWQRDPLPWSNSVIMRTLCTNEENSDET